MRKIIPGNLARIIRDMGAPHDAPRDLGSVDLELPQKKKRRWACMTKPKQHLPCTAKFTGVPDPDALGF